MKKSILEKLHEAGLWDGPKDFIKNKIKYAYQTQAGQTFNGCFEKGAFSLYPEFDQGNNLLYLGKPSDLFMPVIGRDKIRDFAGELKVLETQEELAALPRQKKEAVVNIQRSAEVMKWHPLDWTKQNSIIDASVFDNYDVQLVGVGPLGLEIAISIMKMGVTHLTVHDSEPVQKTDLALGSFRVFDSERSRQEVAYEILADQVRQPIKFGDFSNFGSLVINTNLFLETRKKIWNNIRGKQGLFLDVQLNGLKGKLFAINPADPKSIELYESSLIESRDHGTIAYMVKLMAGITAGALERYVGTPGGGQTHCLDRLYLIDAPVLYRTGGAHGSFSRKAK